MTHPRRGAWGPSAMKSRAPAGIGCQDSPIDKSALYPEDAR
jgi:hypothetical protein